MKKLIWGTATAVALTAAAGTAHAFEDTVTLGVMASTTGAGLEASWRFDERFSVTANYAGGIEYSDDYEEDGTTYDGDLEISAGAIKFDYFPFKGKFYLTAGAALPDMTANAVGTPEFNNEFEFNGQTYDLGEVSSVRGDFTIADSVQPYLGLGWRSSHTRGFGFFSEFGLFSVDPEVSLSAENTLSGEALEELNRNLVAEERDLQDDLDDLPFYPVATLGVRYTF